MLFEGTHTKVKFEAAAVSLLRYIEENADGFRILVRDSSPGAGSGTYGTLLADIAGQVEYIMDDFLKSRGRAPKLAPMYSQMMVGMVAFTGQWWLDARKPRINIGMAASRKAPLGTKIRLSRPIERLTPARAPVMWRRGPSRGAMSARCPQA